MTGKISIISYESSAGRTMLARNLFAIGILRASTPLQLIGFDIEKPDLLQFFNKVKFNANEVFAGFPKVDRYNCRYCGACINYCDCRALSLDRNIPAMIVDPEKCEACGECISGCNIHGISTKDRLTGYILHGRLDGHSLAIGKADDRNDFLVPLVCALNRQLKPGADAICDLGPGISGFVLTALKETSIAIIVQKPSRGWERNIRFLQEVLKDRKIHYGIVVNKYRDESGFLQEVTRYCDIERIQLLGVIPFIPAMESEKSFTFTATDSEKDSIFAPIWNRICAY